MFVSKFTAQWFTDRGYDVYVLNRGTRPQVKGVRLIQADRHALGQTLRGIHFDAVLDVCAYQAADVDDLLDALDSFDDYVLISSSAVYPETLEQPFREDQPSGFNSIWGAYGMGKIAAENALLSRCPGGYILRPPYLYGPMQNVYREPFVFDCALADRTFYLPGDGSMKLQFFHVEDLCRVMEALLLHHPVHHVINVGNADAVTVREFVSLCYQAVGARLRMLSVPKDIPQRSYFSFYDYQYMLDTSRQAELLPETIQLEQGIADSLKWYLSHPADVARKDYIAYIDHHLTHA